MIDLHAGWTEVLMYVGGPLLAGAVLFLLKGVRLWVTSLYNRVLGKRHKNYPETKYFIMDRNIHEFLVEIRTKTNADRCCLFQFHNGQVFSSSNPVWRTSCTHESCRVGASHEMGNRQSLLASSLIDLLGPMFSDNANPKGMRRVVGASPPQMVFTTSEMEHSFWKTILVMAGNKTTCVIPLAEGERVIGFVTFCFRDLTPISTEGLADIQNTVIQIMYELKKYQY